MDKFKEEVVFEIEKDKPLETFRAFRNKCIRKYGFSPSTELIIRINNYQKQKYGTSLYKSTFTEAKRKAKNPKQRNKQKISENNKRELDKFIKRIYKEEINKFIEGISKYD